MSPEHISNLSPAALGSWRHKVAAKHQKQRCPLWSGEVIAQGFILGFGEIDSWMDESGVARVLGPLMQPLHDSGW
jgi:hypothetical protein